MHNAIWVLVMKIRLCEKLTSKILFSSTVYSLFALLYLFAFTIALPITHEAIIIISSLDTPRIAGAN